MFWKQEAMEKLRDYTARKQSISTLKAEQRYTDTELKATADENERLTLSVYLDAIKARQHRDKLWVAAVDSGLSVLTAQERRALELFYISPQKGAAEILAAEIGATVPEIFKFRDTALRRFTIAFYGICE